jgi:hypothetical protein
MPRSAIRVSVHADEVVVDDLAARERGTAVEVKVFLGEAEQLTFAHAEGSGQLGNGPQLPPPSNVAALCDDD